MYYYLTCRKKVANYIKMSHPPKMTNVTYYLADIDKDNNIYETSNIDARLAVDILTARKIQRLYDSFKINIEK